MIIAMEKTFRKTGTGNQGFIKCDRPVRLLWGYRISKKYLWSLLQYDGIYNSFSWRFPRNLDGWKLENYEVTHRFAHILRGVVFIGKYGKKVVICTHFSVKIPKIKALRGWRNW
jgi:hypothetical protein